MIDRPKALIAAATAVFVALLLVGIGFLAGQAGNDDDTPTTTPPPQSGDGLPAGPAGVEGGIPVGFAQSEDGARAAATAWVPWFLSSPASERPEALDDVLAEGVEAPWDESMTRRLQFAPLAIKIEMTSEDQAVATLLGPVLSGSLGEELAGEFWKFPVTLEWDSDARDWRIAAFPVGSAGEFEVDGPLEAADVEGFEALRPVGALSGPPIVEAVPGD